MTAGGIALLLQSPSGYVLGSDCVPTSSIMGFRARLQGIKFWAAQLHALDAEISRLERYPEVMRKAQAGIDAATKKSQDFLEQTYRQHPELRPSDAARAAAELREQADAIEYADAMRLVRVAQEREIGRLRACRPVVTERATSAS